MVGGATSTTTTPPHSEFSRMTRKGGGEEGGPGPPPPRRGGPRPPSQPLLFPYKLGYLFIEERGARIQRRRPHRFAEDLLSRVDAIREHHPSARIRFLAKNLRESLSPLGRRLGCAVVGRQPVFFDIHIFTNNSNIFPPFQK